MKTLKSCYLAPKVAVDYGRYGIRMEPALVPDPGCGHRECRAFARAWVGNANAVYSHLTHIYCSGHCMDAADADLSAARKALRAAAV